MNLSSTVEALQTSCRNHDVEEILALFTEDATLCGEGAPGIVGGQAALREALVQMLQVTPELTIDIQQEVSVSSDSAVTWLHWHSPNQEQLIEFRSLTVWRNCGGSWKIVADMFGMGAFQE